MVERPPEHPDRRSELREDLSKSPLAPPQPPPPYEPVLLRNIGVPDSHTLEVALSRGAYQGLEKARRMPPEAVIEETKKSGLRGRGGAGFPTGQKWSFVPKDKWPHYLIVNADESEPGTFKDRAMIEQDPHLLIEGTLIAAHALQAKVSYIYIRGEMLLGAQRLEGAIAEARAKGLMGEAEIYVHRGAGAYICGEETGLLESLEGKRGYPRLKPPFPAVVGLSGSPRSSTTSRRWPTSRPSSTAASPGTAPWARRRAPAPRSSASRATCSGPATTSVPWATPSRSCSMRTAGASGPGAPSRP